MQYLAPLLTKRLVLILFSDIAGSPLGCLHFCFFFHTQLDHRFTGWRYLSTLYLPRKPCFPNRFQFCEQCGLACLLSFQVCNSQSVWNDYFACIHNSATAIKLAQSNTPLQFISLIIEFYLTLECRALALAQLVAAVLKAFKTYTMFKYLITDIIVAF